MAGVVEIFYDLLLLRREKIYVQQSMWEWALFGLHATSPLNEILHSKKTESHLDVVCNINISDSLIQPLKRVLLVVASLVSLALSLMIHSFISAIKERTLLRVVQ